MGGGTPGENESDRSITTIDPSRQIFEVEAMTRVRLGLPQTLLVKVPKIHHFDVYNNLIVMEDCGADAVTIRELLCSGGACSTSLAETIGTAVGDFIALLHEWSRSNPDGILDIFDKCLHAKKMAAEINYNRLVATLQCSDRDDLPLLSDFETDPSDIQAISKLMDEYHFHLMSARVPGSDVVSVFPKELLPSTLTNAKYWVVPHGRPLVPKHPCQH